MTHNLTIKSTHNSWFPSSKTMKMGDLNYVDREEESSWCWSEFPYNLKMDV